MEPAISNYASAFRDTRDYDKNNKLFGWGVCRNCLCIHNIPQEKTYFSTRYHNWIEYSEPDWHFDNILSDIKYINNIGGGFQYVIGLSYKDTTLVEAISKQFNIQGYPSDIIGITNDWFNIGLGEAKKRLSNHLTSISKGKRSIIIARRILDHCASPIEFLETLNCQAQGSVIYIEINDYKQLVKNNIYDFIWNERTFYPFPNHVETIINKTTLCLLSAESICTNSESIFYSFAQINHKTYKSETTEFNSNSTDINILNNYIHHWHELKSYWNSVCLEEKLGIVGASHTGISFSQLFLNKNIEYYLFDDSEKKKGKHHPDKNIVVYPTMSLIKNQVNSLIITVSEKWYDKLKRQIQAIDGKVKLYTFEGTRI